jgi:hypothetical protein
MPAMPSTSRLRSILVTACLVGASAGSWAAAPTLAHAAAPKTSKSAPAASPGFELTVEGVKLGTFPELVSISSSLANLGAQGATGKKMSVVLRRPIGTSLEIASWHQLALATTSNVRKATVIVGRGADGKVLVRYHLTNAYPSKVEVTGAAGGLTETVTFACDKLERVSA